MVATGVTVSDDAIHEFNNVVNKHRSSATFVIYKIENENVIVTEHLSESQDFQEFLSLLPDDDCRYALYKTTYTAGENRQGCKLVKITWAPSGASVRKKMICAASSAALGAVLGGAVTVKLNVKSTEDLTMEAMQAACNRFSS
jgi:cofilin